MDEGVRALFDYTVFHIGIYITMSAALIATEVLWNRKSRALPIAVFFLVIAGACGGSIASNVPNAVSQNKRLTAYLADSPTLFGWKADCVAIGTLTQIEHGAFWIAISILLCRFLWWPTGKTPRTNSPSLELAAAAESLAKILRSQDEGFQTLRNELLAISLKADAIPELQRRLESLELARVQSQSRAMHPNSGPGAS